MNFEKINPLVIFFNIRNFILFLYLTCFNNRFDFQTNITKIPDKWIFEKDKLLEKILTTSATKRTKKNKTAVHFQRTQLLIKFQKFRTSFQKHSGKRTEFHFKKSHQRDRHFQINFVVNSISKTETFQMFSIESCIGLKLKKFLQMNINHKICFNFSTSTLFHFFETYS